MFQGDCASALTNPTLQLLEAIGIGSWFKIRLKSCKIQSISGTIGKIGKILRILCESVDTTKNMFSKLLLVQETICFPFC